MTPMLRQYHAIKNQYPDCLLFFRLGDFYELFFEDAVKASSFLGIALTKRGRQNDQDIPMCGVPFHSADTYIARLIKNNFKIALCEQLETPEDARKRGAGAIVERGVVRIITPGTLIEEGLLENKTNNFLVCLIPSHQNYALSYIDISTGEFSCMESSKDDLLTCLSILNPKELLVPQKLVHKQGFLEEIGPYKSYINSQPDHRFQYESALNRLKEAFQVAFLDGIGDFSAECICASGTLLEYVKLTQGGSLPCLKPLGYKKLSEGLYLDESTRRTLELTSTLQGKYEGSLLSAIDYTKTAGGGRLLRHRLNNPLGKIQEINHRLDQVTFFMQKPFQELQKLLCLWPDLERLLGRIALGRALPKDLICLKKSLCCGEKIAQWMKSFEPAPFVSFPLMQDLLQKLEESLEEDAGSLKEGGFIKKGFSSDLDHLREVKEKAQEKIFALQKHYANLSGVSSLKIKLNALMGLFIEVSPSYKEKLSQDSFIHRQSLAHCVRFTTHELMEIEESLLNSEEKVLMTEQKLFNELCGDITTHHKTLYYVAQCIHELDVSVGLAALASKWHYVRPEIKEEKIFDIKAARHPVVEQLLPQHAFIPNDCTLSPSIPLWLLTGPNMAGKSTFLRQNALIVLLAHIGSFVPAEKALIGLSDRIFSRVGAADDLSQGRSTFMVEMLETATILNQASERSFVILDEVGRGTSTYDGMALAAAILQDLLNRLKVRGIFATHYHELSHMNLHGLERRTIDIKEWEGKIVFLHRVIQGSSQKSYGIHVAQLAGVPSQVIKTAYGFLEGFEEKELSFSCVNDKNDSLLAKKVAEICLDSLTPKQALDFLYELKTLL